MTEVRRLRGLSEHKIPYVIIKGMASAAYYPDPFLRAMGDVDFLVPKEKLEETKKLLLEQGYKTNENSNHHAHRAFHRGKEVLEMHWEPNGIPEGKKGDICREYLSDIIETATPYETQNERFLVPDTFSSWPRDVASYSNAHDQFWDRTTAFV